MPWHRAFNAHLAGFNRHGDAGSPSSPSSPGPGDLYLAGLEKSGAFVEHADEIAQLLGDGSVLVLDDGYIYRYVLPGKGAPANPYGSSTYYSSKLIFKTRSGQVHVVTVPT